MRFFTSINRRPQNRLRNIIQQQVEERTHRFRSENQLLLQHYMADQSRMNEMNDSLRYARHLQTTLLPSESRLRELVPDAFMLNIPRDTLSGDFCWCTRSGNRIIIAVADCTGHGVPGALMSMLGLNLLNRAVIDDGLTDPSAILCAVDNRMKETFEQHNNGLDHSYDGMDVAVCVIDSEKKELMFAGAMRPLFIQLGNELKEISGARYPIGGLRLDTKREFPSVRINYSAGDNFYLFSDGITDQFGGANNKKFTRDRLRKLITSLKGQPAEVQRQQVHECHVLWRGEQEQTDDVLIVGVRLP